LDIEAHLVRSGDDKAMMFVCDTARVFPSQSSAAAVYYAADGKEGERVDIHTAVYRKPKEFLYRLLRPELVLRSPFPLSSDAYFFGEKLDRPSKEVAAKATTLLLSSVIPSFASYLEKCEMYLDPKSPKYSMELLVQGNSLFLNDDSDSSQSRERTDCMISSSDRFHEYYEEFPSQLSLSISFILKSLHSYGINIRYIASISLSLSLSLPFLYELFFSPLFH
jgi:hypothetical protein